MGTKWMQGRDHDNGSRTPASREYLADPDLFEPEDRRGSLTVTALLYLLAEVVHSQLWLHRWLAAV
jgi:hypothetical protein